MGANKQLIWWGQNGRQPQFWANQIAGIFLKRLKPLESMKYSSREI